jgi:hypothetical protein
MAKVEIIFYKDRRLTVIEQAAGGWLVSIVPIAGGKPVHTETFRERSDAIAAARVIVDDAKPG